MRALAPLVLLLATLTVTTACSGGEHACTLIGTPVGVGVDVDPVPAAKVSTGTLKLCWNARCRTDTVEFYSADKGKHGFVTVDDLPMVEMQATLRLTDAAGEPVVDQTLPVTAEQTYPNGPDCGAGGPQQQLLVDAGGAVRVR